MLGITWPHFREVVATVAIVCEAVELGLYLSILLPATPALWDPSYFSPDRSLLLAPRFTRLFSQGHRLAPVQP